MSEDIDNVGTVLATVPTEAVAAADDVPALDVYDIVGERVDREAEGCEWLYGRAVRVGELLQFIRGMLLLLSPAAEHSGSCVCCGLTGSDEDGAYVGTGSGV